MRGVLVVAVTAVALRRGSAEAMAEGESMCPSQQQEEEVSLSAGLSRLVSEEMATLERSIAYQQKKLEILTALRRSYGASAEDEERLGAKYCVELRRAMERLECDGGRRRRRQEESRVLEKARVSGPEATALRVLSFRTRGVAQRAARGQRRRPRYAFAQLLAVGHANGTVAIADGVGETIASIPGSAPVVAIGFDGTDSAEPALAVATADSVSLYNLTLWRDDVVVAGRRPRPRNSSSSPTPRGSALSTLRVSARGGGSFPLEARPLALGVLARRVSGGRELKFVVVADDARTLSLRHAANGTLRASTTFDEPIVALERAGGALAVAHGAAVSVLSASRWTKPVDDCLGPDAPATAIAFDSASPAFLHVAYASGDLLVFNTRARREGKPYCKLAHRLPRHPLPVLGLAASSGFLLSLDANATLHVRNTTFLAARQPSVVHSLATGLAPPLDLVAAAAPAGPGPTSTEHILAFRSAQSDIFVYESLYKFDPEDRDISWMRMPILFVGLLAVFAFQIMRKRSGPGPPSSFADRRLQADAATFMREFAKHQGARPGRRGLSFDDH